MFVFGDSFVDNGNVPRPDTVTKTSRSWFDPYGTSYVNYAGTRVPRHSGRFSNNMVQSDVIATWLGLKEAPMAYETMRSLSDGTPYMLDNSGMTFAVGGSGVFKVPEEMPTLATQIDNFQELIDGGVISQSRLTNSVAPVAVSGNDYARVGVHLSDFSDITAFIATVTKEIVANVQRLQKLGVQKILVNSMPPIGCMPSKTAPRNYSSCEEQGNMGASTHNCYLQQTLGTMENVLIVDLNTAFTSLVNHAEGQGSKLSKQFKHKFRPCCESLIDADGYCGQISDSVLLYTLCVNPDKFFYWDDMNPTQAGWVAVMTQLEDPIKEFLEL